MVHKYNGMQFTYKKDEITSFVTTWLEIKIIMLTGQSQTQKDKYGIIYRILHMASYVESKNADIIEVGDYRGHGDAGGRPESS